MVLPRAILNCLLTLTAPLSGQLENPRVEQLAWMAGCWELTSPQRTVHEQWTKPAGQTMLGVGRTVRDGKTVEHEFIVIKIQGGRLAYEAHPSGQAQATFLATQVTESSVVFENPDHDFPQRVGYQRRGDSLQAWIDGAQNGRTGRVEFPYQRVTCP